MQKMLFVTPSFPPEYGGASLFSLGLVEHLDPEKVIVITPQSKNRNNDDASKVYTVRRPLIFWPQNILFFLQLWLAYKKERPEMVFIYYSSIWSFALMHFIKKVRVPVTFFLEGNEFQRAWQKNATAQTLKKMITHCARVLVDSQFTEKIVKEKITLTQPVVVAYPALSECFLQPAPAPEIVRKLKSQFALEGKKIMLSVGKITEEKGFLHLARLFPRLIQRVPQLVWVVIGDGPDKKKLVEQVHADNMHQLVRFLPPLPQDKLVVFYRLADVFALLTVPDTKGKMESFGTVFIEAASQGLAIVAGKGGGVEEAVQDIEGGVLVDAHNDEKVLAALVELLTDSEYAKELGLNAQKRSVAIFTWAEFIKRLYAQAY